MWTNNSTAGNDSTGLPPVRVGDAESKYNVVWMEACVVVFSAFTVLIFVLNLFLLVVVLSSSSLRSNPRNKFLLSLVVCHLLEGTSTGFDAEFLAEKVWKHGCRLHLVQFLFHLFVMDFVLWWGVVALLLHYLARLLRYEGPGWFLRLPSKLQRAALPTAVAMPWLAAGAIVVYVLHMDEHVSNAVSLGQCLYGLSNESIFLKSFICFYLPGPTLVVLMIAVPIAYRFKSAGTEDGRSGEINLGGRESMDPPLVYMLTGGLTLILLSPQYVSFSFNIVINPPTTRYVVMVSLMMVASLLPIVLAPLWLLLLRDVKERCVELAVQVPLRCRWLASYANNSARSQSTSVAFSNLPEE